MKIRIHYYILRVLITVYPKLFKRYFSEYCEVKRDYELDKQYKEWVDYND